MYDYRTGVRWARRIKVRIAHPPQFGPAVSILSHSGVAKSTPNGWNYGQLGYLYTTTDTNLSARYWCDDECRTILIHRNTAISITHPNTNSPDTNLSTQTLLHKPTQTEPSAQTFLNTNFFRALYENRTQTARSAHPREGRRSAC